MKKIVLTSLVVLVVGGAVGYFVMQKSVKPEQRPAFTEEIERTPARVARGRYLTDHAFACFACHTDRDWTRWAAPYNGPVGGGGNCLSAPGMPVICTPNITPHPEAGIGSWTDGELVRALREGVDHEGNLLFPMMPYEEYRRMSDEDARAIVAYLRTLQPVASRPEEIDLPLPARRALRHLARPLDGPVPEPNRADPVSYGAYLTKMGNCQFCHSPLDENHQPRADALMSGGSPLFGQWGFMAAPNLTRHPTGLGNLTQEQFIARFRANAQAAGAAPAEKGRNTSMPWIAFRGYTDEDLASVYAFLRSLPPIENRVVRYPEPPKAP